jgi:hypothetical protein
MKMNIREMGIKDEMWAKLLRNVVNDELGLDVVITKVLKVLLSGCELHMALGCSLLRNSSAEYRNVG